MTNPDNFNLVGVPPVDLIHEVVVALTAAGFDALDILKKACDVTREFVYDPTAEDVRDRIKPRFQSQKLLPVKNRSLEEILDPQPKCSKVLKDLLLWIDRVDIASTRGEPRPSCKRLDGGDIFPAEGSEEDLWSFFHVTSVRAGYWGLEIVEPIQRSEVVTN